MLSDMLNSIKWNITDSLTALRIVGSLCLMLLSWESPEFFAVYTLAGLTDILDGWFARKTGTVSAFGAKLDGTADLVRRRGYSAYPLGCILCSGSQVSAFRPAAHLVE